MRWVQLTLLCYIQVLFGSEIQFLKTGFPILMAERGRKLTIQTRIWPLCAIAFMPHDIPPCVFYVVKQDVKIASLLQTCYCSCASWHSRKIHYIPLNWQCCLLSLATARPLNPRYPFDFAGVTHARPCVLSCTPLMRVIQKVWLSSGKAPGTGSVFVVFWARSQQDLTRQSLPIPWAVSARLSAHMQRPGSAEQIFNTFDSAEFH
jgi:hypothetical protein